MLSFVNAHVTRLASGALLAAATLFQAHGALAGPSQAIFAYTGAGFATSLQVTAGGVTTIIASGRGWYDSTGSANGATPDNNYIAGICGNDACGESPDSLTNNWFAFGNLPPGAPITAASLLLDVPPSGSSPGFISSVPALTYTVFDVSTPVANLGTSGAAIFADLGSGTPYGSRVYTAADMGTTTSIPLNAAAITYLNANRGVTVAFGGAVAIASTVVPVVNRWPTLLLLATALLLIAGFALRALRLPGGR